MVESGSLVGLPLTNVVELRQEKFYLKAQKRYLEIAGWETAAYMQGTRTVGVSRMAYSK
jgi:hypothetical protein